MDSTKTDNPKIESTIFRAEKTVAQWQKALMNLPNPHPLQSWPWAQFKSRWGWSALPRLLDLGLEHPPPAAAMVLKRKVPRLPFSILYVPKGPILDYNHAALRRVVLAQLEQLAQQERAIFVKIDPDVVQGWDFEEEEQNSPIGSKFIEELLGRGWRYSDDQVQFRNTVELDIDRPAEDILAAMKSKTRYNIRLAGRKDVVVRRGTAADFPTIAGMYMETADRDDFTVRPTEYYLDAWQTFYDAGLAQPFIAEYEGTPLGAVIIVRSGQRAIYMYGASTEIERQRMPNYLLQWEAILWAQEQGCTVYDFWGAPDKFVESDPLWGVWRFKDGFQGQVVRHIGAWDYPARPFWYWVYTAVMPRYLDFMRRGASG